MLRPTYNGHHFADGITSIFLFTIEHCYSDVDFSERIVWCINTLGPRQDGHHYPGDIFKCIFLNENVWISIKISLKFVPKGPINNIPSLVQIMAWRRPGDKPLSEPMMVSLLTHWRMSLGLNEIIWTKGDVVTAEIKNVKTPVDLIWFGLGLVSNFVSC